MPDYRVEVELLTMDGTLGRTVSLEAWWSVSHGAEKARVTRKSSYSEPVAGQDYEALVQAQSRALAALSRDIAGALKELPPPGAVKLAGPGMVKTADEALLKGKEGRSKEAQS